MTSPRLTYRPVGPADLETWHALATDDHVRRYLLDGQLVSRAWAAAEIAASEQLFAARSVGLWLASDASGIVGFCGFRVFADIEPHPQLLYALVARATGQGLATEMAQALVAHARAIGFAPLRASVDEVNSASVRVLEKAGFALRDTVTGELGPMRIYER